MSDRDTSLHLSTDTTTIVPEGIAGPSDQGITVGDPPPGPKAENLPNSLGGLDASSFGCYTGTVS
jgi:hypothetical protein